MQPTLGQYILIPYILHIVLYFCSVLYCCICEPVVSCYACPSTLKKVLKVLLVCSAQMGIGQVPVQSGPKTDCFTHYNSATVRDGESFHQSVTKFRRLEIQI